jgi:hypothetical protein
MLGVVRLRNTKHHHHTKDHTSSSSFSGLLTQHGLKTNEKKKQLQLYQQNDKHVLASPTPPHITKHQFKIKKIRSLSEIKSYS